MPKSSLRLRATLYFAAFGAALSLLLATASYLFVHIVGHHLLVATLESATQHYIEQIRVDRSAALPVTDSLAGYRLTSGPTAPVALRGLEPGLHEIALGATPHLALVTDYGDMRLAFTISKAEQAAEERNLLFVLGAAALALTALITVGGLWLTRRAVSPIIDLARRVAASELDTPRSLPARNLDDVSELGRIFERYLERIRSCADRERAFASDVSHELRTPLAIIQGAVEVLEDDTGLKAGQRERIRRIERASHEMTELTSALLRLSREESGATEERENCSMACVVRESVDKHRSLNGTTTVDIDLNIVDAPLLPVEKGLAHVVVDNLLGNAVLHAQSSRVLVCLERSRLLISDSGKGIDEADLGRLFQRHYRGSSSGGSGIGLSLVKRICDLHGWEINIDSTIGKGTSAELVFGRRY